jgi:sodium ion-translocating decarboxylase beta subunit
MVEAILKFLGDMGIVQFFTMENGYLNFIMILISFLLLYLAIVKKYEPLLLLPIAFGMLLTNLPGAGLFNEELWVLGETSTHIDVVHVLENGGLLDLLYLGVKLGIYPPLIFLGVGAMTDFGPLIANPKSLLLGAAAQLGIFIAFFGAMVLKFSPAEAAAIGIIGGADGPTAIYSASKLAPNLLGPIAVAAYSYMALVPIIQPPIMKALTTKKERLIRMKQLRPVSKTEKIIFPIAVTAVVTLILPSAAPLVGMLMLGNLFRESGVVERLSKTAQNELNNIVVIFLGVTVGATATGQTFLSFIPDMIAAPDLASALDALFISPIGILVMGLLAFCFGTAGGVLLAKLMNTLAGGNSINPLIGSAGVSAVPMAARVSQTVGAEEDPHNFLLMHAMGPNVAGVIGSAVAAGVFLSMFAG